MQNKTKTKTINTSLIGVTLTVPANFTALHLAHISWNLYCDTAPAYYENEFSISEASDFAHYNIHDQIDKAQHFYECAFAIGSNVEENINYTVQEAYDCIDSFYGDTVVREDVSFALVDSVKQFITHKKDYATHTDFITEDYAILREEVAQALPSQIAKLEEQLTNLKSQQTA
jgi:hypothetical protein